MAASQERPLDCPSLHQVASLPGPLLPPGGGPAPPRLSSPGFPPDGAASQSRTIQLRTARGPKGYEWVKRDGVVSKFSSIFRSRVQGAPRPSRTNFPNYRVTHSRTGDSLQCVISAAVCVSSGRVRERERENERASGQDSLLRQIIFLKAS